MKITCTQNDETGVRKFDYVHQGHTFKIELTHEEFTSFMNGATLEQMCAMPGESEVGFFGPVVAFAIYSLVMFKPGNVPLLGFSMETSA